MLMLALRLLPRDAFDVISLIDRWNRRRQFRDMVASGYDPFGYTPPKRGNAKADPNLDRIQDVRATINEALARSDLAEATKFYMELRAIDPQQVLSRQNQLDLANHLFEQQQHAAAADAYEGYLRVYPRADQADHVMLVLGLIYARYLNRPDKAAPVLEQAVQRLRNERDIELAKEELSKIAEAKPT
jgi:outer membrane protein assembly factor BamD (BamD/ComL family)